MSIGTILLIVLVIALLGGFSSLGGGRFYGWDTSEGFSNTLFPAAGYVLGRFEGGYRF